ncbi:MAG: hypothetical protein ACRDNO_10120, partial [Trebonia sp.]
MTVAVEEFTEWRDTVEVRLDRLEAASDTHAVKIGDHGGLLTAMDKDLSDAQAAFRAQLGVLNAVRETQSEQTATLREHTATLREHTATLREHTERLERLETGQAKVLVGIQTIIGLLP